MQLTVESFTAPRSSQTGVLQEMYDSPELFNEGVLSFQYPLLVASDKEMEQFLGKLVSGIGHAVGDAAKGVGSVVSAIDKVVPISMLTSTLAAPLAAGIGAVQAAAEGRNVFQGALRSLVPDIGTRFLVDTAAGVAGGKNILKAAEAGMKAGIGDIKKSLQFAAMVAPFVPGIGTGVGAALGAANALANGEPITDALIAAARSAVPGGQIGQMAFDVAAKLAKGQKLGNALLEEARSKLPGGPIAQAAFDVGLSLAQGKNIQQAALQATGKLLPKSPFAESAMDFVKKVASGQNLQQAALSQVGNLIQKKILQQTGPLNLPGFVPKNLTQAALAGAKLVGGVPAQRAFAAGAALAKGNSIAQAAMKAAQARARIQGSVPKASMPRPVPPSAHVKTIGRQLIANIPAAKAPQAIVPGRPVPAKSTPFAFPDTRGGDGFAALPVGSTASGGFIRPTVADPQAGWKSNLADSYNYPPGSAGISSANQSTENGQLPTSGRWFKKNGQLRVVGAYA